MDTTTWEENRTYNKWVMRPWKDWTLGLKLACMDRPLVYSRVQGIRNSLSTGLFVQSSENTTIIYERPWMLAYVMIANVGKVGLTEFPSLKQVHETISSHVEFH
jgi:hypothetical protein